MKEMQAEIQVQLLEQKNTMEEAVAAGEMLPERYELELEKAQKLMLEQINAYRQECMSKLQAEVSKIENKIVTEQWLMLQQIPYDRLLFDRPKNPIYINETPANAKYHKHIDDNDIVAMLFEEWKEWTSKQKE